MFTIIVIAVAIGVFAKYIRYEQQLRRKRRALEAAESLPPPQPGSDDAR